MSAIDSSSGNRIFFSCVSDEFEKSTAPFPGFRSGIRFYLTRADCEVKVQEDFRQEGAVDTVEKLDRYIRRCAAVIHLVGESSGAEANPQAVEDYLKAEQNFLEGRPELLSALGDFSGISYTQWEALIALHHRIPLFVYATPTGETAQNEHLSRLRLGRKHGSERLIASPSDLLGQLIGDLREIIPAVAARSTELGSSEIEPKCSSFIAVRASGSDTTLNLLMRWGFFQKSAVVLLKTDYGTDFIISSFVHAEKEGQTAAKQVKKPTPCRVWLKLSGLTGILPVTGPSEIVQVLTQIAAFRADEKSQLENGQALLGLVIDGLPDLSPSTMAKLQMWLDTVQVAFPLWKPLVILVHASPDPAGANATHSLTGTVECLSTMPDFSPVSTQVVSDHAVGELGSHGIGALLSLAWGEVPPSDIERASVTKLLPWLSEAPEVVPRPLRMGGVIRHLESLNVAEAAELATVVCAWLIAYQPRLAAPFFQSLAGASIPALPAIAARFALDHSSLMDALLVGVPENRRSKVLNEVIAECPMASGNIAVAWVRGVLRRQLADSEVCLQWIRSCCPSLTEVVETVIPSVNPGALLNLLKSNAAAGNFHWIGKIASCLDLPLESLDAGARQRTEYWTLVQSLPADCLHLRRIFSLPAEELAILGCYGTVGYSPNLKSPIEAHAQRIRQESIS